MCEFISGLGNLKVIRAMCRQSRSFLAQGNQYRVLRCCVGGIAVRSWEPSSVLCYSGYRGSQFRIGSLAYQNLPKACLISELPWSWLLSCKHYSKPHNMVSLMFLTVLFIGLFSVHILNYWYLCFLESYAFIKVKYIIIYLIIVKYFLSLILKPKFFNGTAYCLVKKILNLEYCVNGDYSFIS